MILFYFIFPVLDGGVGRILDQAGMAGAEVAASRLSTCVCYVLYVHGYIGTNVAGAYS